MSCAGKVAEYVECGFYFRFGGCTVYVYTAYVGEHGEVDAF